MVKLCDPSSAADARQYSTKHIKFDWTVDFSQQKIYGTVWLTMVKVWTEKQNPTLVLDSNNLVIQSVVLNGEPVAYNIAKHNAEFMGSRLEITNPSQSVEFEVEIKYETSPTSSALQWLEPQLTADKKQPFVFSQCQAIHARSLFPCQDTPSVKSTYDAVVHIPKDTVVVMSAIRVEGPSSVSPRGDDWTSHYFQQETPIPSYLVTLACGDLATQRVGPRSSVWAEPSVVAKAAYEFAETEKLLLAAEELCGPYVWKVYDILILPPTFPYGGMENPCITFVSPTLLAGDRSMVNVVAHEIAHSWTGNLVTNMSWEHFWLNEGHTIYLERLIMERMEGTRARHLELTLGYAELLSEVERLGNNSPMTCLVVNLLNIDPDETYNKIPYEKGSLLLYYLETKFGKDVMLGWLKAYLKHFCGKALDTATWMDFIMNHLGPLAKDESVVPWNEWLHATGLPKWDPTFEADDALRECNTFKTMCISDDLVLKPALGTELLKLWEKMSTTQRQLALRYLSDHPTPIAVEKLLAVDSIFDFSRQLNAELRFYWSIICIHSRHLAALDSCFEFLNSQGRMKYTRPLYIELNKWADVKDRVHKNFISQKPYMHRTTAAMVAQDIGM